MRQGERFAIGEDFSEPVDGSETEEAEGQMVGYKKNGNGWNEYSHPTLYSPVSQIFLL